MKDELLTAETLEKDAKIKELEKENETLYRVLKCCDVDKFQEFCERKLKEKER